MTHAREGLAGDRQADRERELTIDLLRLVNANARTVDLVKAAIGFFKHHTGCDAVAIRLRAGEDFPYFEWSGFPEEFILNERFLCSRDATGSVVVDCAGSPLLECMCGDVISGRVDPARPHFTAGGSFWTNSTTEFLTASTRGGPTARRRNRCNGEKYESVALVPLTVDGRPLGLLQLNDHRKGMFCAERVALWERLAVHLAVAVARSRSHEGLFEVNRRLHEIAESAQQENRELTLGNRILQVFARETSDALFDKALDIVLEGLESPHGVFGYVDESGSLICPTMSRLIPSCEVEGKGICYPRDQWKGLWSRALLEKRTQFSNEPVTVPYGHVSVLRNLATPILFQGEVIGLFNLANKGTDYDESDAAALDTISRRIAPVLYAWIQRELREKERSAAEQSLRQSENRFKLLSETAGMLLASDEPQRVVNRLCRDVMAHLDCHAFLNFLVDNASGRLRLNTCAGISDDDATRIEWLDCDAGICGCVARAGHFLVAENIQATDDPRTDFVRSHGMQAYCCHPLVAQGHVIGTLSFGTRSRSRFSAEDIALMKTVADQVAVAMQRVQSREKLREANALLVESDQRKNEFLAVLSHELRNPLAPISNSLYVLEHAAPGGNQAKRAKEIIDRQIDHLSRLVDDLLDVTRITRNKVQLQKTRIDLCDVVRRSVEDQRSLFDGAGIRLETAIPRDPVFVDADATRMAQIVGNLLQNSSKFTGHGGVTRVRVASDVARSRATVSVSDTGVGMTPETLAGLFQPFMQADKTLDRTKGGLGLGLALVKGLVELHGGQITARSDGFGKGAEFLLELPLNSVALADSAPGNGTRRAHGRRVLIIEDNVDSAASLREVLQFSDHEVEVAHSGPDGIARARTFCPEIVLCDLGLPGMDGYDVARAFRADAALGNIFLVALSGYALPEDLQRAQEAGFAVHLPKPPNLAQLIELLGEPSSLSRAGS